MAFENLKLVRRGDKIAWNFQSYVDVPGDGYLINLSQSAYSPSLEDCLILELPASRRPAYEIGKCIQALADLVVEARKSSAEAVVATASHDIAREFNSRDSLSGGGNDSDVMLLVSEQKQDPLGLPLT